MTALSRACLEILSTHDPRRDPEGTVAVHIARCASCASHLQTARRQLELLQQMPPVRSPHRLASRSFFESIVERATDDASRRLGSNVARALRTPYELGETRERVTRELRGLPRTPAPGMLWPRLRAEYRGFAARELRLRRTRRRIARLGFAAAAVITASLYWIAQPAGSGPEPEPVIVFVRSERPLATGFSVRHMLRDSSVASRLGGPEDVR